MARIGIVHGGWHGHFGPANRLGRILVEAGHEVVAWAPERFGEAIAATGAEPQVVSPQEHALLRESDERRVARWRDGLPGTDAAFAAVDLGGAAVELTGLTIEALHEQRVEAVVHDVMSPWGRLAAEFLGLGRIVSVALFPLPGFRIGAWTPEQAADHERHREAILGAWGVDLGDMTDALANGGETTVCYTIPQVAPAAEEEGWRMVGPLMAPPAARRANGGPPLVYVAFGTIFGYRTDALRAVIEGLAGEDVRVLVSTGGRDPREIGPPPDNAEVVPWVDSREVLREAAVHVTHGGAGSVHESLLAGVPMVCLPPEIEQQMWSESVEELGAARVLPDEPEPAAIRAAVAEMLAGGEHAQRATGVGRSLLAHPGPDLVAEAVERSLG